MCLIVPGRNASGLDHATHGAAMVGAVQQKVFHDGGIAGHKTTAQAGHIAALGQAGKRNQAFEIFVAQLVGCFKATQRGLVAEINFAVALVGGNDESVFFTERK